MRIFWSLFTVCCPKYQTCTELLLLGASLFWFLFKTLPRSFKRDTYKPNHTFSTHCHCPSKRNFSLLFVFFGLIYFLELLVVAESEFGNFTVLSGFQVFWGKNTLKVQLDYSHLPKTKTTYLTHRRTVSSVLLLNVSTFPKATPSSSLHHQIFYISGNGPFVANRRVS